MLSNFVELNNVYSVPDHVKEYKAPDFSTDKLQTVIELGNSATLAIRTDGSMLTMGLRDHLGDRVVTSNIKLTSSVYEDVITFTIDE